MNQAWVTLATNDNYAVGALVLGQSLRNVGTTHKLHIMVTPGVSDGMRSNLARIFSDISEVDVLDSNDQHNLALLGRPDLGVTFTKLHCWCLTQYSKCVFLDADCLVIENSDDLFDYPEFSAAPDIGWPDVFNSGVFVFVPSNSTYDALLQCALQNGSSFDGGDQGLLNKYFFEWSRLGPSHRIPFGYNMSSSAVYTYAAAYKRFAKDVRIVHFLGSIKPWHHNYDARNGQLQYKPESMTHMEHVLQWWQIFAQYIMPNLAHEYLPYSCVIPLCCLQGTCAMHRATDDQQQPWSQSQPWQPSEMPSFYDAPQLYAAPQVQDAFAVPPKAQDAFAVPLKPEHVPSEEHIFEAVTAEAPSALPSFKFEPEPDFGPLLSKVIELLPDLHSHEPVSIFPSYDYQNRLTHCPVCSQSLSFLDEFFPVGPSAEEIEADVHRELFPHMHKSEEEAYHDRLHQMAFESGAIDYSGRDSWENIQKYLDEQLK